MAKYKVNIEENLNQVFEIEAEEDEDPIEKAIAMYWEGKLVVDNGEVSARLISLEEDGEWSDFIDF